jgi:hypothetical protein
MAPYVFRGLLHWVLWFGLWFALSAIVIAVR